MAEVISALHCKLCGHKWFPRSTKPPKVCPKCKRYGWGESPWEVEHEEIKTG